MEEVSSRLPASLRRTGKKNLLSLSLSSAPCNAPVSLQKKMTNHPPLPPVPGTTENKTCVNENCKRTGLLARKGGGGQRSANEKPIRWRKSKGKNKKKREFLFFEFARSIFLDRSDALLSLKNITHFYSSLSLSF